MAVPSAVTRRKEQDAAALRNAGINPDSGAPIDVQATTTPAVAEVAPAPAAPTFHFTTPNTAQPATPTDDVAELKAKIAGLEQQLSTQNGRASSSTTELEQATQRNALLEQNRQFLENSLQELTGKLEKLQEENNQLARSQTASGVTKVLQDLEQPLTFTEEEQRDFKDSAPFIQKVVKQTMAAALKPVIEQINVLSAAMGKVDQLDKRLPELGTAVQAASTQARQMAEQQFFQREVTAHFPDFLTVKETPEWKAYVHTDIPGRGIKIGQLLVTYQKMNNAPGIRAVLQNFYDQRASRPTLNSLAVPAKTSGDVPAAPEPVKLKSSEYNRNLNDFVMKRMSKPDWEAYKAKWDAAFNANNVEFDAPVR